MGARSVDEYAAHVASLLQPLHQLPSERVALRDSLGRVIVNDVHSPVDLPLFRNSQMDGYAVDAASIREVPVTLPVRGTIAAAAGTPPAHVPGSAQRIMTGAPIPEGADAIVPVEDTDSSPTGDTVTISRTRSRGEFVRERGSDVQIGTLLLPGGTRLEPRHLAVLAAVGLTDIPVRRLPRVAVITTGTELVTAGQELSPGQIFDSNGLALASSAEANGAHVISIERSSDDTEVFRALLDRAVTHADVVFTSGGVSMGDFEVVKDVLRPLGGEFGHIAMQPGGPQGVTVVSGVPVLSFPGNPVSTLVSFEILARPHLRAAAGREPVVPESHPLTAPVHSPPGKRQFLRGRRAEAGVETVAGPGSHLVAAMSWADVLIDLPAHVTALEAGELVKVIPL
ncbi:MAG: molybdopterin molybdotransferase MoeA [Rhodococcus sp.]|nr:molybdopterin molybdotransferase MoeA [Rhodococcus sp. (in: high G+C Gram-positive bacteria)]